MLYRTLRSLQSIRVVRTARYFHAATASLVSLNSNGKPDTKEVRIFHGDPHETFVLIPPEIGRALQAGTVLSNGTSLSSDPERHALTFFHKTRSFAHALGTEESSPSFPRLEIPRDLPRQTDTNRSPATLFLVGVSHTIALDGTSDAKFAEMSAETYKRLKPSLEKLKAM